MIKFPTLKKHLDRFQNIITSENKPYGLNRARNEKFFKGERIIVQRKCPHRPSFVYVNFDSYFNRTFLPIKTNQINLKYLTAILNSKICSYWLKYRGKMQGNNYQIDKDPVLSIPIKKDKNFSVLETIVPMVITSDKQLNMEEIIDAIVFELYFPDHMKERKIDVLQFVEKDIEEVMNPSAFGISPSKEEKFVEFEKLSDTQKEQVITELHTRWSDPKSEIVKRMNSFSEKSPDILKPILES